MVTHLHLGCCSLKGNITVKDENMFKMWIHSNNGGNRNFGIAKL